MDVPVRRASRFPPLVGLLGVLLLWATALALAL
jgi:hypothetical protein